MERQAEADAPVRRIRSIGSLQLFQTLLFTVHTKSRSLSPYPKSPKPIAEADIAAPAGLFIYCFELRIILRMPDKKYKTLSYV